MENKISTQNLLEDPLTDNEVLPEFANKLQLTHWSPTQASLIDAAWLFRYVVLSQAQRRLIPSNAQMSSGVAAGEAVQYYFADIIYKLGPHKKLIPTENFLKGKDKNELIKDAVDNFKNYKSNDEKDEEKKQKYINEIPEVTKHAFLAVEEILNSVSSFSKIIAEQQISLTQRATSLLMPLTGRTDISIFKEATPVPTVVCEMKTQWSKLGKVKKDGSRSFIAVSLPALPAFNHLMQCAYYAAVYKFEVPIKLFYVGLEGYKIFDSSNCNGLTVEGLKKNFQQLLNIFRRREKLLSMYQDLDRNLIITNLIDSIDMNRDHPWAWSNIGDENLQLAEELWKIR